MTKVGKLTSSDGEQFVAIMEQSLAQVRALLKSSPRQVSLTKVLAGLRQGLRELPLVLRSVFADISLADRYELLSAINGCASGSVGFLQEQVDKACEVMRRGRIDSEEEWYLLRWHLDQSEARAAPAAELTQLTKLLDAYEARG